MLLGFYSGLVVFIILFLVVVIVFIKTLKLKARNKVPVVMLGVLMVFTFIVASIYTMDFYLLQTAKAKSIAGNCSLTMEHDKTIIDQTMITIDDTTYKARRLDVQEGQYYCELTFLPITKTVTNISIY